MDRPHALLWSGGKDSALALRRARASGIDVRRLVSFYDADSGRVRFHATRVSLLQAQADALEVELKAIGTTWEAMEAALQAELEELAGAGYAGVVLGDIHLADVRAWYEQRVRAAGPRHLEPIWGERPADLVAEFAAGGGRAVVTCVDLSRLDRSWLGRVIDDAFVADIAGAGVDPCGENGEYHSFAYAGPPFQREVAWRAGEVRDDGRFAQLDLLD